MNSRNDQVASILSWTSTVLYGSFLNPQQYCAKLQAWSKYADIFNSAYPLALHDPKAALQALGCS